MSGPAHRVGVLAAAVRADAWSEDARALIRDGAARPDAPASATLGDVARAGVALVQALVAAERWDAARTQARHMAAYFSHPDVAMNPVGRAVFAGLAAATSSRDADEVADVVDLLGEMFPAP